ncbi:MAG: sigma-70 family RNA polymerase sigma factor [Polyangiaceae bacterium]|nr:sigma-70 family RNA polymerase sigma factor [Polyangiaceae bacterium]
MNHAAERYKERLGRPLATAELSALEPLLQQLHAQGRAAHPSLDVPLPMFAAALALHARKAESNVPVLQVEHAGDFYLAVACAEDVPGAVEIFRRTVLRHVPAYVGGRAPGEEVEQLVAIRLLVTDPGVPRKIAEYTGKGALGAWVRVVATRIALNLRRKKEPRDDTALLPLGAAPEVDLSRFRHQAEFKAAFEQALADLPADERLLLRLHSIERAQGDELARLLEVDRSTIMRRLARARERLFEATRVAMMTKLGLSRDEFASLARDVQSQIDLSLSRVFA